MTVEIYEVPGGLEKGLSEIFGKQAKKRKDVPGFSQRVDSSNTKTVANMEMTPDDYLSLDYQIQYNGDVNT